MEMDWKYWSLLQKERNNPPQHICEYMYCFGTNSMSRCRNCGIWVCGEATHQFRACGECNECYEERTVKCVEAECNEETYRWCQDCGQPLCEEHSRYAGMFSYYCSDHAQVCSDEKCDKYALYRCHFCRKLLCVVDGCEDSGKRVCRAHIGTDAMLARLLGEGVGQANTGTEYQDLKKRSVIDDRHRHD